MCHDQDTTTGRYAYGDKTALFERVVGVWVGCRQGIFERGHRLAKVDPVLAEVAGRLGWVPLDDHAPSIAEIGIRLLVCPTLGISCKGRGSPAGADLVSFIPLFDRIVSQRPYRSRTYVLLRLATFHIAVPSPSPTRQECA